MEELRFLTNEAHKIEGLAYAGFETFKGSPYTSCARETGQNSRDAATGKPVQVLFKLHKISREEIPFAASLQHAIECCLRNPQDEKTRQHLERAKETICTSHLKVLEISDFNTTGLTGPTNDPQSVFAALVKGDGVTNKTDEASAGSFGIGKNAAFAVSDLQAVIYTTLYKDKLNGSKQFAAQGRLRLISHVDGPKRLSAEGYWGGPDFHALENVSDVPGWMQRKELGTSIFSIGFREQPHWVERMTLSLATNFFLAIHRKEIEFSVGESTHINHASLASILASAKLEEVAIDTDQIDDLRRARRLFECVTSDLASHHEINIPDLGDFTLHLLVSEKMPREAHVLRNGIYITDNFNKFSEPMRRFPGVREFSAVIEPSLQGNGKKPSALLKQLENPAHDAFEPERLVEPVSRERAKKQIKLLIKRVRDIIKAQAKMDDLSSSQLEELSHLFGVTGSGDKMAQEQDPRRFTYGDARKGRRRTPRGAMDGQDGRGHGGGRGEKPGNKPPKSPHPSAALRGVRSVLPNPSDLRGRTVYFTPSDTGKLRVTIAAAGLSGDVKLSIVQASTGHVAEGYVTVPVSKGERIKLDLVFSEPYPGPIELTPTYLSSEGTQ